MSYSDFESYVSVVTDMVNKDSARDAFFTACDEHAHMQWAKPAAWKDVPWLRPFITADNANALDAGERTLATKHPSISIMPILRGDPETDKLRRAQFDQIELALDWHYRLAEARKDANPTRALVSSALRYDEYVGQVIYLPHQDKALKAINGKRLARAKRNGPFLIKPENPRNVHTLYSDYMLENLVMRKRIKAHEFCSFWGDRASGLKSKISGKKIYDNGNGTGTVVQGMISPDEELESNYYIDNEIVLVWCSLSGGGKNSDFQVIGLDSKDAEHGLPFIPWFHGVGGSDIETTDDYRRKPLLSNVVRSGSWHNQMLFGSLFFSVAMARAIEETTVTKTATGEGVERDLMDPNGQLKLRQGEEATRFPAADVAPGVKEAFDRFSTQMQMSSGTKVLQTLDFPSGSAFASLNAILQAATAVLDRSKQLSEQAIGEVIALFTDWLKFSKDDLSYYKSTQKSDLQYGLPDSISYEMLPEHEDLYIKVELKPVVPTDQLQRINGATMMSRDLNYPTEALLEEALDVTDARAKMDQWRQEQLDNTALATKTQDMQVDAAIRNERKKAIASLQLQTELAAMQQQMQQAQQQQGAQGQPGQQLGAPGQAPAGQMGQNNVAQAPFQAAGGPGFAGNMGGQNPGAAAPDIMREQITGQPQETMDMGQGA